MCFIVVLAIFSRTLVSSLIHTNLKEITVIHEGGNNDLVEVSNNENPTPKDLSYAIMGDMGSSGQ